MDRMNYGVQKKNNKKKADTQKVSYQKTRGNYEKAL